jgi:hypothetical protein
MFSKGMIILDVFYVAVATIVVIALLQLGAFVVMRILYPPAPQIIYRDVPVQMPAPPSVPFQVATPPTVIPPPQIPPQFVKQEVPPALTQKEQEVQLPEYEQRSVPTSTSLRMDAGLPDGIQETRPPGL